MQATDDEIFILMKRYQELSRAEADDRLLRKIMGTLAMIHTQDIPAFLVRPQAAHKKTDITGSVSGPHALPVADYNVTVFPKKEPITAEIKYFCIFFDMFGID